MSEPTCTESAPCFACARCVQTMANVLRDDPNVRAHMAGIETRPTWRPAWKLAAGALPSADGGGQWTPDPQKPDHYTFGPLPAERTITLTSAHIATLPTGERVELPAGTVLREGTLPPEAEDDRPTLGEQIHDEHDRVLRDLTERIGLPREMVPSVTANGNGNAETCGAVAGPTTCANRQWLAGSRVCSRAPHVGGAHEMDRYGDAWYGSPDDPPKRART